MVVEVAGVAPHNPDIVVAVLDGGGITPRLQSPLDDRLNRLAAACHVHIPVEALGDQVLATARREVLRQVRHGMSCPELAFERAVEQAVCDIHRHHDAFAPKGLNKLINSAHGVKLCHDVLP